MEKEKIKSVLESILFASGEEMKVAQLAKIIGVKDKELNETIEELAQEYKKSQRGFAIVKNGDKLQMATNPDNAEFVEKTIKKNLQESLSRTALEVLAIVAYRGPIAKTEIEAIRGVNSSFTLRNLLMRGLIVRNANENDQRGYLYEISLEFLKKMGLEKTNEMPEFENLSRDKRADTIVNLNVEK